MSLYDSITPELVQKLLGNATPGPWNVDTGHPNELEKGCKCMSCWVVPTIWYTTNSVMCDDQPDNECSVKDCEQEGYTYQDAALIAAAPDIAKAYLALAEELDKLKNPQ